MRFEKVLFIRGKMRLIYRLGVSIGTRVQDGKARVASNVGCHTRFDLEVDVR